MRSVSFEQKTSSPTESSFVGPTRRPQNIFSKPPRSPVDTHQYRNDMTALVGDHEGILCPTA